MWPSLSTVIALMFVPNGVRIRVLRLFGAHIAPGVVIRPRVKIRYPDRLSIGRDSWVGEAVTIDNRGAPVLIDHDVVLSQSATLVTRPCDIEPLRVEPGAWIALRSTVVGSVTVGAMAVVAAAATVFNDVPPHSTAVSPRRITTDSLPELG